MTDYIKINRRDWLKRALSKTKDVSLKATSSAVGNFAEISDTLKEYRWESVSGNWELMDSPKQIMFKGKSVFLVRNDEQLLALQGICPIDKQLIFWQGHTKQFYCPNCEQRYDKAGISINDSELMLNSIPARIAEDRIQLRID